MKTSTMIILFTICFLGLFYISVGDEIIYYNTTDYSDYEIEIELMNGSIDTIIVNEPSTIHFQINCHTHKGDFQGCDLEAVPGSDQLLLGGHWKGIRDGVINFRILNKY